MDIQMNELHNTEIYHYISSVSAWCWYKLLRFSNVDNLFTNDHIRFQIEYLNSTFTDVTQNYDTYITFIIYHVK